MDVMSLFRKPIVHNPAVCKLGRSRVRVDSRTLYLAKYIRPEILDPPPASVDWTAKVANWPMMLNDSLGDCTCAAAGHMIQAWTANIGAPFVPTDPQVETAYEAVGGYRPGDQSTDNGAVELDVLNFWRKTGIAGHLIMAYVAVATSNQERVKQAVNLFGGVYIGLALPVTAQSQDVWDVSFWGRLNGTSAPGSWGGHAVPVLAYDADGLTCITWGAKKRMTWKFFAAYCDEAYAPLSPDWIGANGLDPAGLDLVALQTDLQAVAA